MIASIQNTANVIPKLEGKEVYVEPKKENENKTQKIPPVPKEQELNDSNYSLDQKEKEVMDAIEQANKKIIGEYTEAQFSVHEKTKQIMIKIVDSETKETIKEIPPEKIVDMVANMCEVAGILVDEKR